MSKKKYELTDVFSCVDDADEEVVVYETTTLVGSYNLSDGVTHWRKGLKELRTNEGHAVNKIDDNTFDELTFFGLRRLTRI